MNISMGCTVKKKSLNYFFYITVRFGKHAIKIKFTKVKNFDTLKNVHYSFYHVDIVRNIR
jgi:hypothetical protein